MLPKNQWGYYILALAMCIFIVFPIQVPHELAAMIDTTLGKILVCVITLNMFLSHPLIGSIGIVAAYELVRRSSGYGGHSGTTAPYVPSEKVKTGHLNKYNQFPVTVEEEVIKDKIPYTFNMSQPLNKPTYVPITEDTRESLEL